MKFRPVGDALHEGHLGAIEREDRRRLKSAAANVIEKQHIWHGTRTGSGVYVVDADEIGRAGGAIRIYGVNHEVVGATRSANGGEGILRGVHIKSDAGIRSSCELYS